MLRLATARVSDDPMQPSECRHNKGNIVAGKQLASDGGEEPTARSTAIRESHSASQGRMRSHVGRAGVRSGRGCERLGWKQDFHTPGSIRSLSTKNWWLYGPNVTARAT
eukprot:260493-Amphidinium_carterae.5